jgi:hypothetical protein
MTLIMLLAANANILERFFISISESITKSLFLD